LVSRQCSSEVSVGPLGIYDVILYFASIKPVGSSVFWTRTSGVPISFNLGKKIRKKNKTNNKKIK